MCRTSSAFTGKPYDVAQVCRVFEVARSTVYWRRKPLASSLRSRGPQGFFTDAELAERIRAALAESPFTGEGYRKVWGMLRDKDVRTSKERTLRLIRKNSLLAVKRPVKPHGSKAHNGTIKTGRVDEMLGTDMTTTMTLTKGNASIFFAIDHCSLEVVGIRAARHGTKFEALEQIQLGIRRSFGAFGKDVAAGLTLRHDHGSQFISEDFQREIGFLGIKDSPSYVREPQGNGIAERFVRTFRKTCSGYGASRRSRTCARDFSLSR